LNGLDRLVRRLDAGLSSKDKVREQAIALSRELVRACAEAIRELREKGRAGKALGRAGEVAGEAPEAKAGYRRILRLRDGRERALQELAEAHILEALVTGKRIPAPRHSTARPRVPLGMGDAIGELRRVSQDALRRGNIAEAEDALRLMEGLFAPLNLFDYPDAIVPLKHKQDVARGLIEKTPGRGGGAAVRGRDLERKIAALGEGLGAPRPKRR